MKPVRLPAAATLALPRWALFALGMLYILPGLIGRDPWKDDAGSFGIMWTMARGGLHDWLYPNIAGLAVNDEGPLAFWLGAICIKLFGWLLGDVLAARVSNIGIFVAGTMSLWYTAFHLGRRPEAQPLRLAFGGQPAPDDYGRTLADTAVLVYLGSLGLLLLSHETLAVTLQGSLIAYFLYRAVRYIESASPRNAALVGLALGALTLTRGPLSPVALAIALFLGARFFRLPPGTTLRHLALSLGVALLLTLVWVLPASIVQPFSQSPIPAWLAWNMDELSLPNWASISAFFRVGVWFFWPAWPFAGWAIWAWRRQQNLLHIVLPLTFLGALTLVILCDPTPENGDLLKLLPPLALMAAFGLPTMKRGAINAIDWFSVMVLTTLAALVWLFWIAKLTGWPARLSHNALKLVPGFVPEFGIVSFLVAASVTIGWIVLVRWRVSRQPAVLWRAVVLSSSGLILLWVLLMTLFLPDLNYRRSYAGVAQSIAAKLPPNANCIDTNVGSAQRASFAYFGRLPFVGVEGGQCDYVLLQDSVRTRNKADASADDRLDDQLAGKRSEAQGDELKTERKSELKAEQEARRERLRRLDTRGATLLWEGRRASDRDERFRLYRRR